MSAILNIDSIAYGGSGVSRLDGFVYFTPYTCPGETIQAEIVRKRKTFAEASVVSIITPSADRLKKPECTINDDSGNTIPVPGCVYGHVDYHAEILYKQSQFLSFLTRQAKIPNVEEIILPPVQSPKHLNYRNKTRLLVSPKLSGGYTVGYIGDDNETIIDIPECPLSAPEINEALHEIRNDRDLLFHAANAGGTITLRWTPKDGVVIVPSNLAEECIPLLREEMSIGTLNVPIGGFSQVNPEAGRLLVDYAAGLVKEFKPVQLIDFYCGVGVFALTAAVQSGIPQVTGFDIKKDVIKAANKNAGNLSIHAKFECISAGDAAKEVLREAAHRRTTVILDPPRAGLEHQMIEALLEYPPEQIIYVSCAPDMLARDIAILRQKNTFSVTSAKMFDMFPRTARFESVVVLQK